MARLWFASLGMAVELVGWSSGQGSAQIGMAHVLSFGVGLVAVLPVLNDWVTEIGGFKLPTIHTLDDISA